MYLGLHRAGQAVTLIDSYGDLAELVLAHLVAGATWTPDRQRVLPFNVLAQPDTADRTALMAGETTLTIIGNLTEDPQLRTTSQGQPVVNVTVASTQRPF